jgi:hypothetical protein
MRQGTTIYDKYQCKDNTAPDEWRSKKAPVHETSPEWEIIVAHNISYVNHLYSIGRLYVF